MLGEQIYTGQGKRTARRVIGTRPVNVEVSFEDSGKLIGIEGMNIGTYTSKARADGTLAGEGKGVFALSRFGSGGVECSALLPAGPFPGRLTGALR
jgi:hypothetical protein